MQHGLRGRIVPPAPPAPVPEKRPTVRRSPTVDMSTLQQHPTSGVVVEEPPAQEAAPQASDAEVVSSTSSMAIATLMSRITGFMRNVLITTVLGGAIASAFNSANSLPNIVMELVLGSVLTSLVVPVLVRAEREDPDRGEAFIRRLFTLALMILGTATVVSVAGAPVLTRMLLGSDSKVNLDQATSFAYLLLPQIFFYGMFALFMAILNTKSVFKPGAWAPVVNNVVTLAVLAMYLFLPGELHPEEPSGVTDPHVLLLGVGTTLGVITQALIMLPYIRRSGISLRPLWGIDDRLREFGSMAIAIVAYVAISQAGYFISTQIAAGADAEAPNIYQQAWMLLQVPYGIIGVTLLTAIMPRLSRNAAAGDDRAVVKDLVFGSKLTFLALVPIVVFLMAFGVKIALGLFAYGKFGPDSAQVLGYTLVFSAFTLLPYALVLLHLRVFFAREEAWVPTIIFAGVTGTKVALSALAPLVAGNPTQVVTLLAAANGFGYIAGAIIGHVLLRRKLGNLGTKQVLRTTFWALGASVVGAIAAMIVVAMISMVTGRFSGAVGSLTHLVDLACGGVVFLVVTGLVLARSGLPEVTSLGQSARRIPGVGRFITVKGEEPAPASTSALATAAAYSEIFNAVPIPPPMSAGIVRGPRLVPGAQVADGRFRLLADHGAADGARFWHALEKSTGAEVALIFVDTSGRAPMAPASPDVARQAAAEVRHRTLALAELDSVAIPSGIRAESYRNGCLIVADWVHGTSLAQVADSANAHPHAALHALRPLLAAANETVLGLDNKSRIRIGTDGVAKLAFPAVLAGASRTQDLNALHAALVSLIDIDNAPEDIQAAIAADLEEFSHRAEEVEVPLADELDITDDQTPTPEEAPGFGAKGFGRTGTGAVAVLAVLIVVVLAAITVFLTSALRGSDPRPGPVVPSPTTTSATLPSLPIVLGGQVTEWTDADSGAGSLVTLADTAQVRAVVLTTTSGEVPVRIRGFAPGSTVGPTTVGAPPSVFDIHITAGPGRTDVAIEQDEQVAQVFVEVFGEGALTDIKVVGTLTG